jgi:hypothetical protein
MYFMYTIFLFRRAGAQRAGKFRCYFVFTILCYYRYYRNRTQRTVLASRRANTFYTHFRKITLAAVIVEDLTQRPAAVASRRANNFDTHFHRKHFIRPSVHTCNSEDLTQRTAVANRHANNFDTIYGLSPACNS